MLGLIPLIIGYLLVAGGRQLQADRSFHPIRVPAASAPASDAAGALGSATTTPAPVDAPTDQPPEPTAAGVAKALAGPLGSPNLGPSMSVQVYDASTGRVLFGQRPDAQVEPASTAKLLTAAAVLMVHKPTDRFTTKVVAGATPGSMVLLGGGDPTLSGAPAGQPVEYPEAARMSDLAAQVRRTLGGRPVSQIVVDDSLFSGPAVGPGWSPDDAPSSYACMITAAMVDAGRDQPDAELRSANPDLAAGAALAAALGGASVIRGRAAPRAAVLATVQSAPVGVLVEQMLRDSDNVIAEVLSRQVALATGAPGSFAAGAAAIRTVLAPLGITAGTGMHDGSGLSALDRIPATALTQVLLAAVGDQHPTLRFILSGLSVAGWDGSLVEQGRFSGPAGLADGVLRAKTGSLTGVSSMAGVVTDADGRELIFAFVADQAPSEGGTRDAIDQLGLTLARCGCS